MAETQVGRIERAHAKEYVTTYEAGRVFEDGGAEDFLTEGAIRKYNKQLSDQKIESLQGPLSEQKTYSVNMAKWKAAEKLCKQQGWEWKVITEKELKV